MEHIKSTIDIRKILFLMYQEVLLKNIYIKVYKLVHHSTNINLEYRDYSLRMKITITGTEVCQQ
jgi:hypothetical protein